MIWRAFGRIISVSLGFILAAAVGAVTLFGLGMNWAAEEAISQVPENADEFSTMIQQGLGMLFFFLTVSPLLTLLPAISVAVAGELARIRSAFYYIAAGGVATAVMPIIMYYRERELSSYTAEYFAIIATAGFVGGLVYWLIAGRNA